MHRAEREEGVLLRVPGVEKRGCFPQVHRGERAGAGADGGCGVQQVFLLVLGG